MLFEHRTDGPLPTRAPAKGQVQPRPGIPLLVTESEPEIVVLTLEELKFVHDCSEALHDLEDQGIVEIEWPYIRWRKGVKP